MIKPCLTDHTVKKNCIVTYIPDNDKYIDELKTLIKNIEIEKIYENSDLIIFTRKTSLDRINSIINNSFCKVYESIDIIDDPSWYGTIYGDYYKFVNSLLFFKYKHVFTNYKYIFKTDTDVFLTPKFNELNIENNVIYVGTGKYSNDNIINQLTKISVALKIPYSGITNVGATWYGNSELIIKLCEKSYIYTKYIFKDFENNLKSTGSWPKWWQGTSSMYGSELAINELCNLNKVKVEFVEFDHPSSSSNLISSVYHIHCYHDDVFFCKFRKEEYNKIKLSTIHNKNIIKDYCLYIYLQRDSPNIVI